MATKIVVWTAEWDQWINIQNLIQNITGSVALVSMQNLPVCSLPPLQTEVHKSEDALREIAWHKVITY